MNNGYIIILTISLCTNLFQTLCFWLLVIAYKGTIDSHREQLKEIDELTEKIKKELFNSRAEKINTDDLDFPNSNVHKERKSPNDKIY